MGINPTELNAFEHPPIESVFVPDFIGGCCFIVRRLSDSCAMVVRQLCDGRAMTVRQM